MNLNLIDNKVSLKELRDFGFILAGIVGLIFGIVMPYKHATPMAEWPMWPWGLGAILILFAVFAPQRLHGLFKNWTRLGQALGFVNSRIILGILFFFVVTPVSFILRFRKTDLLHRELDTNKKSYRIPRNSNILPKEMEFPH